jgi:predicted DNA-binding transcriptional regulator AlpA
MTKAKTQKKPIISLPVHLLRLSEVLAAVSMGRTQWTKAVRDGRAPAPIAILEGGTTLCWFSDEVSQFIEARRQARDEKLKAGVADDAAEADAEAVS